MVKRANDQAANTDRAKVRVIFAEVEGNNESVQEALRTMVSAMSRPVKIVTDQKIVGNGAQIQDQSEPDVDELEVDDVETATDGTSANSERAQRGTGKKIDRNAGLQLVPNLNFMPPGEKSLKDFFEEKSPANDNEHVLVTLYYIQHVLKQEKISPSHVMTAFKEVGKPIPADLRQTIRNIKKTKIWLDFDSIEELRTTTQGQNQVEHKMGNGG